MNAPPPLLSVRENAAACCFAVRGRNGVSCVNATCFEADGVGAGLEAETFVDANAGSIAAAVKQTIQFQRPAFTPRLHPENRLIDTGV
jgi:hypothetical protein